MKNILRQHAAHINHDCLDFFEMNKKAARQKRKSRQEKNEKLLVACMTKRKTEQINKLFTGFSFRFVCLPVTSLHGLFV